MFELGAVHELLLERDLANKCLDDKRKYRPSEHFRVRTLSLTAGLQEDAELFMVLGESRAADVVAPHL